MQNVIRLCEQEQSANGYIERGSILCINPLVQGGMHIGEFSGVKSIDTVVENSDMVR